VNRENLLNPLCPVSFGEDKRIGVSPTKK